MAKQELTDFTLEKNAYAAFDALSMKSLIKQRLGENGSFTGQNFEGSNMSSLIDVIAYSYHVLLFYLNQTSTESMFSEAELYENMNRIVKSIDYKPVGFQTSTLTFESKATASLAASTYTIPRYSFFNVGGTYYSFSEDITFTKTTNILENLQTLSDKHLLFQGQFKEYVPIIAIGENFETVTMMPGDDAIIDHFNIHVYVKSAKSGKWEEWTRTSSLFLERSTTRAYEVRLNENKRYQLKFGNGVTGRKLQPGDTIAIYYLMSDGQRGEVGIGALNQSRLVMYDTMQFATIYNQVKDPNIKYINQEQMLYLIFNNSNASSEYYRGETVDDMRDRAPKVFATQYRLVTKEDYENYIIQTHTSLVRDVKVINNWEYLSGHFKYIIDTLNLPRYNNEPRTLLNQVNFADACDFNNLYCYVVPRIEQVSSGIVRSNYLTPAQKNVLVTSLRRNKTLTTELLIMDPVYIAADIGIYDNSIEDLAIDVKDQTELVIVRDSSSTRSFESIQNATYKIIVEYFRTFELGAIFGVSELITSILNQDGINKIYTRRKDTNLTHEGLSMVMWNPIFPKLDVSIAGSDITLPYYKYPYLDDPIDFIKKIVVETETSLIGPGVTEY